MRTLPSPVLRLSCPEHSYCKRWKLGVWEPRNEAIDCTQDGMWNTMMQHAGRIPIELIVQECNGTSVLEQHWACRMSFTISEHTSSTQHGCLMECLKQCTYRKHMNSREWQDDHNGRTLRDSERMNKQLSQLNHTTQLATWCYQITEHLSARLVKEIRLSACLWSVHIHISSLHIHTVQSHVIKDWENQTAVIQVYTWRENEADLIITGKCDIGLLDLLD